MSTNISKLNKTHIDALKEIGNIGAGNAATSLSSLMKKRIDMLVPVIKLVNIEDVPKIFGGEEAQVSGIYLMFKGEINGFIMVLLDIQSATSLTNLLIQREIVAYGSLDGVNIDELYLSTLKEIGNILSGAYVTSLATLTKLDILMSTPALAVDMAGAILSVPSVQFVGVGNKVLFVENKLFDGQEEVVANFLLIPEADSYKKLMTSLGVEWNG